MTAPKMSHHHDNVRSSGAVRYEFDANGVLAQITEGIDGVRTHMKFIYDVGGLSNAQQRTPNPEEDVHAQAGPASDGIMASANVDAMDDDESGCQTPKIQSRNGSPAPGDSLAALPTPPTDRRTLERSGSFSTQTSGPLGINHWTRHAPVLATPLVQPPGSDASTEIIPCDEHGRQIHKASTPVKPLHAGKAPSHLSGTTQPADSMGHASARSRYYEYQEAGTRTFECEDPGNNGKAEAHIIIQRCDATNRNLGMSSLPDNVRFSSVEISSSGGDAGFDAPSLSGQIIPPSLSSRASTPMPAFNGSFKENIHPPSEPVFDYVKWKWLSGHENERSSNVAAPSNAVTDSYSHESRPLADLSDSEMMDHTEDTVVAHEPTTSSIRVSGFFSRECSPLTEYNYSVMDATEEEIVSSERSRPVRSVRQLATPQTSPARGYVRAEPVLTRRRAKKLAVTLNA